MCRWCAELADSALSLLDQSGLITVLKHLNFTNRTAVNE